METMLEIDWQGPLTLREVGDLQDATRDVGIYAVSGPHVIYGPYTLVYIGIDLRDVRNAYP